MSKSQRVGVLGAAGETGTSIVNGLIEANRFSIVALVRPSSIQKPANQRLQQVGVELRAIELPGPEEKLVEALSDIDVLISSVGPTDQAVQIPLATAAKKAGVKRFVPCAFITVTAPGVMLLRDWKEEVYNHIKRIKLPFSIVDVGWWYQISLPRLVSGKIDRSISVFPMQHYADGDVESGMTDIRDIGRYVARIIDDERTLNQYIFAYSELWTQTAIAEKLEAMSGDRVHKQPISREDLLQRNAEATEALKQEPDDRNNLQGKWMTDYAVSMFLRGDNQPGYAKYLGYLTSKELYPDMEFRSLESYIEEVLAGTARVVYMTNEAIQNWASTK